MSATFTSELLTDAAGVRIYMTEDRILSDSAFTGKVCVTLRSINEVKALGKNFGFHLTKSKWDPYPWINHIVAESLADTAGLRTGDCLISVDGKDLMGLKVKEVASLIHSCQERNLNLFVWRHNEQEDEQEGTGIAIKGPLPEVASKLANAVSGFARAIECPVCLETSIPPVAQCVHGHIICFGCRPRTSRCPICRVRLGQGRCLLADKLHKIFRDIFDKKESSYNNEDYHKRNLSDWLFGKSKKKEAMGAAGKNDVANPKARQLLLSKLFRSELGKAASADNLTVVSNETLSGNISMNNLNVVECLNLYDRMKSASTGELSNETRKSVVNSNLQINALSTTISSTCSLMSNRSLTPVWGGSMDSVSCVQITCPLSKHDGCEDVIITPDILLAHMSEIHPVPQVHFYSLYAKLSLPLPFGSEAVYILHSGQDLFFFQCEHKTIWITSTIQGKASWEWILNGQGDNGIEIRIRRRVASLIKPATLSLQHTFSLPSDLSLHTLNIQLVECCAHEQLEM